MTTKYNERHSALAASKLPGEFSLRVSSLGVKSSNLSNSVRLYFRPTPLQVAVFIVISHRTYPKMFRIYTGGVVASVKHVFAGGNWAVGKLVNSAVSFYHMAIHAHLAVSPLGVHRTYPKPALIDSGYFDELSYPLREGYGGSAWSCWHEGSITHASF